MTPVLPVKLSKNQFRCFNCKSVFAQRDGNWFDWGDMQVHLCHQCDRMTRNAEERARNHK
jgi:hypothetical protein